MSRPDFRPAPWIWGAHAQTIFPSLLPARSVRGPVEMLDVPVAPGTKIRLLVTRPNAASRGTLLSIHGLSGSAESGYMRRTAAQAHARGWAVVRMNLRNCGGTESLAATLYNAGQSDDVDAALAALEERGLERPYALLGFSMGGNIVMRYAGRSGSSSRADVVAAVNPPVDLASCIDAIERPGNALYHAHFTRSLCAQLARIRRLRPVPGPEARPRTIGGVRGFDDRFTAPDAGYANSAEYYREASASPTLSGLARPALIVSAQDDPFVPVAMFDAVQTASRQLRFLHPRGGGHCGYWGLGRPRFWAASAALTFFEQETGRRL